LLKNKPLLNQENNFFSKINDNFEWREKSLHSFFYMKNKYLKLLILLVFLGAFIGSAVWMYKKYVVPNSPYNKDVKLRGME